MDNLSDALLARAMRDCFPVQYKFLYYDEPCFLKEGTVRGCAGARARVRMDGWAESEKNPSSVPHHGKAMAKHIKASFRSTV